MKFKYKVATNEFHCISLIKVVDKDNVDNSGVECSTFIQLDCYNVVKVFFLSIFYLVSLVFHVNDFIISFLLLADHFIGGILGREK